VQWIDRVGKRNTDTALYPEVIDLQIPSLGLRLEVQIPEHLSALDQGTGFGIRHGVLAKDVSEPSTQYPGLITLQANSGLGLL